MKYLTSEDSAIIYEALKEMARDNPDARILLFQMEDSDEEHVILAVSDC